MTAHTPSEISAFFGGENAFNDGKPKSENAEAQGSSERQEWDRGWEFAKAYAEADVNTAMGRSEWAFTTSQNGTRRILIRHCVNIISQ